MKNPVGFMLLLAWVALSSGAASAQYYSAPDVGVDVGATGSSSQASPEGKAEAFSSETATAVFNSVAQTLFNAAPPAAKAPPLATMTAMAANAEAVGDLVDSLGWGDTVRADASKDFGAGLSFDEAVAARTVAATGFTGNAEAARAALALIAKGTPGRVQAASAANKAWHQARWAAVAIEKARRGVTDTGLTFDKAKALMIQFIMKIGRKSEAEASIIFEKKSASLGVRG